MNEHCFAEIVGKMELMEPCNSVKVGMHAVAGRSNGPALRPPAAARLQLLMSSAGSGVCPLGLGLPFSICIPLPCRGFM